MDDMAYKHVSLILLLLLLPTASAREDDSTSVEMTTCRLASQILGNNQRVCVFVDNSKGFSLFIFLRFFGFCYLTKMIMA